MLTAQSFEITVATDADGGLRLSPHGWLDVKACQRLNEALIGGLRSGVPRLELDLGDARWLEHHVERVVRAAESLAAHLDIELKVTGRMEPAAR